MKANKSAATTLAAVVVIGAGIYFFAPGVRSRVSGKVQSWIGWTEEARRADPVGFTNYVHGRLEADLERVFGQADPHARAAAVQCLRLLPEERP